MIEMIEPQTLFIFGLGLPEIFMISMIIIVLVGPEQVRKRLKSSMKAIRDFAKNEDDEKKIIAKEEDTSKENEKKDPE